MIHILHAEKRDARGKQLRSKRADGKLPAVVYGPKESAISLMLSLGEFEKVFKETGESTVVTLSGFGDEDLDVLVHDVAHHPVTGNPIHVDFYAMEKGKKVQVNVPIEFEGEAPVVKIEGVLTKVLHEVEIEAMPKDLPHAIIVDISGLVDFESHITVADLKVPEGVVILNNQEDTVVSVSQVEEEPEEPVEAVDMDAIEVEEKGKKDEEDEDAPDTEEKE